MATFRQDELAAVISGTAKQQLAINAPMAEGLLNTLLALRTKSIPDITERERVLYDCFNRNIVDSQLTGRSATWPLALNPTVRALAIFLAYAMGDAAAPTGAQADEVQTVTITATGGTFPLGWADFEGVAYATPQLAYDISTAAMKDALNKALAGFGGEVVQTVTKAGNVYTITFGGALGHAPLPLLETSAAALTGVGAAAAVARTTAGSNYEHDLTEIDSYQGPTFTMGYGFHKSAERMKLFYDAVVNTFAFTATRGNDDVDASVTLFGSGDDPVVSPAYTYPNCSNRFGVRPADLRVRIGDTWIGRLLQSVAFEYNLGILDQDAIRMDSVDIQAAEHATQLGRTLRLAIDGEMGDANYEMGRTRQHKETELIIGPPRERLTINFDSVLYTLQNPGVGFDGQANRSNVRLLGRPDAFISDVVMTAVYRGDLATRLLLTA